MAEISVIIPAYNVEKYLPRALDSLLGQTFGDFEVLLVDDGSKDGTPAICDSYAARDARIKAMHQKNAGAPAARNAAIDIAEGKYLFFMDGDDWAEPEMLADLYELAEKTDTEMVIAGFYIDTGYGSGKYWQQKMTIEDAVYDSAEKFRKASPGIFDVNLLYSPWNKLFRTDRVNRLNIRFRDMKMDDFPFNLDYIRDVNRVAVTGKAYYHFMRERSESETARFYPYMFEKREDEHEWMTELFEYWGIMGDKVAREMLARRYVERVFGVIENFTSAACPLSGKEKREKIGQILAAPALSEELPHMEPRSLMMRLMLIPIKLRSTVLTYILGSVMSFTRRRFSGIFARLKAGR